MSAIVYVDVDDTLVRSAGGKRIPVPGVVEHVKQLKSEGAKLYLWSAGGAEYCRVTAIQLGIEHCFEAFLPKPRIMIDDQEVKDWAFCTTFHPATCVGKKLGDYFRV
jgi:phosphoglycolate phosphatase-like HAD superfamily hydrolase